jgi:hypothetical protein
MAKSGPKKIRVIFQKEFVGMLTGTKKGGLERYLQAKNLVPFLPERFKGETWDLSILRFQYPKSAGFAHGCLKPRPKSAILKV